MNIRSVSSSSEYQKKRFCTGSLKWMYGEKTFPRSRHEPTMRNWVEVETGRCKYRGKSLGTLTIALDQYFPDEGRG